MLLGNATHTVGNHIRYEIDYSDWLDDGVSLSGGAVVIAAQVPPITDITVGTVTVTPSHHLVFLLSGGSLNETFTLNVQATDSRSEVTNDTLWVNVVAP